MRNLAIIAVGIGLLLIQSYAYRVIGAAESILPQWIALHLHGASPNLVLPLIVYLGVQEPSMARGALIAFALGYMADVLASAPIGLFAFTNVTLWWVARLAGVRLAAQTLLPRMSLAFAFAVVEGLLVVVLLAVFGADTKRPLEMLTVVLPRAVSTAVLAPPIFRLAQRLQQGQSLARVGTARADGPP